MHRNLSGRPKALMENLHVYGQGIEAAVREELGTGVAKVMRKMFASDQPL